MNKTSEKGLFSIIIRCFMYVLAILWLYPFYLLISATFKEGEKVFDFASLPDFTYWGSYIKVFESVNVFRSFLVSVIITGSTMICIVAFGSLAGYSLGRSKEKIFKWIYLLFAAGMIIPSQSSMIPVFKMGVALGIINTIPFLVLLYSVGSTFSAFIYAGFVKNIPEALEEAARIDGCSTWKTFTKIVFPLLMPATGTVVAIMTFSFWNDFQGPLIYLNDSKTKTLIMAIFSFKNSMTRSVDWGPTMALCTIVSLPMILLYFFVQKRLLKGLVVGSVKG